MTFFAAPMPGNAFRPVSSAPLITPFRLIVATTVAAAIAAPRIGIDRETRRDSRAAPQRARCSVTAMYGFQAKGIPGIYGLFEVLDPDTYRTL